jgi:anti-sigma regulatory factor (Ser/Thr protein kinase)
MLEVGFRTMDIVELVEIALANTESRRVEVAALEPADVAMEAVGGLAQIVSELVDNAIAFSEPGDKVRITGLFDQGNYLISISDRGVGIPDELIAELNRLLDDPNATSGPEPRRGIALVARLAARTGIEVRLVPGVPGTTARVTMPGRLVSVPEEPEGPGRLQGDHRLPPRQPFAPRPDSDQVFASSAHIERGVDPMRFENATRSGSGVVAMSEEARREAEAFLEHVFGPLIEGPGLSRRGEPPLNGNNGEPEREPSISDGVDTRGTVTALRTRIPGENFSLIEDDPSTIAAERAIDIRTALSRYDHGRRAAEDREEP